MRYIAFVLLTLLAIAILAGAQTSSVSRDSFEVVSIKPSPPTTENRGQPAPCHGLIRMDPRLFNISGANAYNLIALAFGDTCVEMALYELLSGAPEWVRSEQFDIQAVIPDGTPSYTSFQVNSHSAPKLQTKLQSLLVDRFKLVLHHEKKEVPIYSLVLAKGVPKLNKSVEGTCIPAGIPFQTAPASSKQCGSMVIFPAKPAGVRFEMPGVTLGGFIKGIGLRACLDRPIIDNSAVSGTFDVSLVFTPDETTPCFPRLSGDDVAGTSIFTALQEQLGLKLESMKGLVDTIVIDHIERPSLN